MIQFDYEHSTYFGDHLKVVIEDGVVRYRQFTVNFPGRSKWISLQVDDEKLNDFLETLPNLEGCMEHYRMNNRFSKRKYTLICHTDKIKKTIHGVDDFQIPVQLCLVKMANLHPELEDVFNG